MTVSADKSRLYVISAALPVLLFAALFVPMGNAGLAAAVILAIAYPTVALLIKKRPLLSIRSREALLVCSASAALFVTILFLSGLYFGFKSPAVPLTLDSFFVYTLPSVIIVIFAELIRNILISQESTPAAISSYAVGVLSELLFTAGIAGITTAESLVSFVGNYFLPAITLNLLYGYLSPRYGATSVIAFRLIMLLPFELIPYTPALPELIFAFVRLIFPLLVYSFVRSLYEKRRRVAHRSFALFSNIITALLALVAVAIMMLLSCRFSFGALVVGSESMSGAIEKGDVIVYKSYGREPIAEGEVIVFDKEGVRTIHRVDDVQQIDGEMRYYTKGDANEERDTGYVTESEIVGTVIHRLPAIGYPTLMIDSLFD